ncbi:hypothetical protein HEQ60_09370 [Haematospirillum sp. H1815]|uniref:AAC(3) family N-acetyltransferase n=1 Tax=Haematospirillum sp. H1815 TaxID=2723108 RepID=UPI00143C9199|nr:AAC(3) family N-acetyltransferase [Haematospirillum sp. H1815]NKD77966.1 hypothetical protein [Haematospirillum sp. H1815]
MKSSALFKCVDRSCVEELIGEIFSEIPVSSPVLVQSSLAGLGYIDEVSPGSILCQKYEQIISEAAGERTLLFPTFNYDCLKNGVFDLDRDYGQVGLLSKYFARKYPDDRTLTPTYNFYIRNNHQRFSLSPDISPFGAGSTMERLVKFGGYLLVLGLAQPTSVLTIGHYIETLARVHYRYDKEFSVQIRRASELPISHKMTVHVRPSGGCVVYRDEYRDFSCGKRYNNYGLRAWLMSAESYVEYQLSVLKKDEFAWLVPDKKIFFSDFYRKFGYPSSLDCFEKIRGEL